MMHLVKVHVAYVDPRDGGCQGDEDSGTSLYLRLIFQHRQQRLLSLILRGRGD